MVGGSVGERSEPLLIFQSSRLKWREAPPKDVRPGSKGVASSGVKGWSPLWGGGGGG